MVEALVPADENPPRVPRASIARSAYRRLLLASLVWALGNAGYVYVLSTGSAIYRVESALLLFGVLAAARAAFGRQPSPISVDLTRLQVALIATLLVGIWLTAVGPRLDVPFLSDDYVFLSKYRSLGDLGWDRQFFRPAFAAAFIGIRTVAGDSPAGFHIVSFVLHVLSAWLVYGLALRLFERRWPALIAAAWFLLDPLQAEAVLWISGLQDVLCAAFVMGALALHVRKPEVSPASLAGACLLAAAALLSKETAICLLVLIPASDWLLHRWRRGPLLIPAYVCLAVVVAAYFVVRSRFAGIEGGFLPHLSRYWLKEFLTTPFACFAQPWNLSAIAVPGVIRFLATAWAPILIFALVSSGRSQARAFSGPVLILAAIAPLGGYFFVRDDLLSSRYLYLPSVGWGLLAAEIIVAVARRRRTLAAAGVLLVAFSAVSLHFNLRPWRQSAELVTSMAKAVVTGADPATVVADWQRSNGAGLTLKDGVPQEYRGVMLFVNGYAEFLDRGKR